MKRLLLIALILLSLSLVYIQYGKAFMEILPLYMYNGTNYYPARMDSSTRSLQTIDYEHHEIHAGSHYFVSAQATIASGATGAYLFYVPTGSKEIHLIFSGTGSAITDVRLIEGVAGVSASGTPRTTYNSNRNSSNTATAIFYDTVTGSPLGSGTTIYRIYSGAATNQSRTPIVSQRNEELILKSGTTYCFWFQSGTADNLTNLQLEWYEHTPQPE